MASMTPIRKAAVLVAGGGVFSSSVYLTYHFKRMEKAYEQKKHEQPSAFSFVDNPNRNEQYQKVASCYDDQIGKDEMFMGINLMRRALLYFHAKGTVLEAGAGTARNIGYYPKAVDRVVLTDASDQMLAQAKKKVAELSEKDQKRFAFLHGDSSSLDLPSNAFDTVVDTFGLCSYDDPVATLKEMARVCKPDGRVLLLEHGRSKTWEFVTRHLDTHAEQHAANWGCVWNRDLDKLLAECSDLNIEVLHKFHFDTTYYVVCRPVKSQ